MSENKRHRLAGISENHKKESIEKIEVQRRLKRRKISSVYIMRRMQVTAGRTEKKRLVREGSVHREQQLEHVLQRQQQRQRHQQSHR